MRLGLRRALRRLIAGDLYAPAGHFYSPIVNVAELRAREGALFDPDAPLPGIDLNDAAQLDLLSRLQPHAGRLPFTAAGAPDQRYRYNNDAFADGDGTVLAAMLMEHRPRRIIEVGSGWSSALMLDVAERFLDPAPAFTFIEPHPQLLYRLMRPGDRERVVIHDAPVQRVPLDIFDQLGANDVLFIDSTHVARTGSDVLHHVFRVLPRLVPGVLVLFHDIFFPFEYPRHWVMKENRSWNEIYLLRAFLMNNADYQIVFFNDYLAQKHRAALAEALPQAMANTGASLWLKRR